MGSTSSKFKKYLQHGDEFAAMQIYQNSVELRKNLDPNLSYGESHNHNTALHYAAKHGMKHLLRTFLNDLGGNPNKKNGLNETVLHSACQLHQTKSFGAQERRATCVQLLLYWKGVPLATGGREKIDLNSQDKDGNTALHWAASSGLKRCVELLLAHGSPLFTENNDKLTPCDLAMRGSHHEIARLLESRMVFADNSDLVNEDQINAEEEAYSGLRSQDLQEAKDQLLVDTSDMLKIPLFTAEALLRNNEWSRELLLEQWIRDPVDCCQLAGVQAPSSVLHHASSLESNISSDPSEEIMCEICLSTIICSFDSRAKMSCKHIFCKMCWQKYLTTKIQDGDAHHILCPAYQCHILVPAELIEKLVSPAIARRYLQFDIKAFVESNKSIKWCPIPGCGRAVRMPENEYIDPKTKNQSVPNTSHAVDCGNSHFFCWECLGEAHAPCGCNKWQEWQSKIAKIKPEELKQSCSGSEDAANCLWLVTNSKPCPNCKSPIQKNEGCNHIKCSKCKFDFCWVCQESWKKHSSATGGYFRCNRYESVNKADEKQGSLISEALDKNNQLQEMSRFLHFFTRYKNHENSQKLEEPLLTCVRQKMEVLATSLTTKKSEESIEKNTKFVEDGVSELLKARRVLCGSYVYGYYLEDDGHNKTIFEFMQNELEEVTEKLSEMIARPYLRTPKSVIVQTTALARRKRHEFVRAVSQGLIPPETPPNQRKRKRKYIDGESETWIRDCDWPDYDSDEETDMGYKNFSGRNTSPYRVEHHQCSLLCRSQGCRGSDYNMEMIIALEMSRLQMIEDRMKQEQANSTTEQATTEKNVQQPKQAIDDQLKLAIQLSLQESTAAINKQLQQYDDSGSSSYSKSNADLTVDYFLKSLANHKFDFKSLEVQPLIEKEIFFKPYNGKEDGRFQISDIHEKGFAFKDMDEYDDEDVRLKRSHSTGDLCVRKSRRDNRARRNIDEPRYHLDSDHSSQHDERPEDFSKKLAFPSTSYHKTKCFKWYPHQTSQGQSSAEDTTMSDSINADMEVCEILSSASETSKASSKDENKENKAYYTTKPETKKHNTLASIKAKLCSGHLSKNYFTKMAVNKSIGLLSESKLLNTDHPKLKESKSEKHSPQTKKHIQKQQNVQAFSKSTGYLAEEKRKTYINMSKSLRIKICRTPEKTQKNRSALETDSSNEYESETGIPKSPTLFISGVSISRTPEPKSPGLVLLSGRQSRSSSLSVPVPPSSSLNISSSSLNTPNDPPSSPNLRNSTSVSSKTNVSLSDSPLHSAASKDNPKSKSASEPEREREMFRFPKSSTDGALSSVLHVQESNLSSDDFHEALFLLERSPKTRDSKRKKKSKKTKDNDRSEADVSSVL